MSSIEKHQDNSVNLPQYGGCRHILDQGYPRESLLEPQECFIVVLPNTEVTTK